MYYLSVLAIFKNETMNLKMWIDHYIWQGVEHFYLIDNGSTDNPLPILKEYIDNGLLTYYYKPEKYKQVDHYRAVFDSAKLKDKTRWLAVCDLDEFFYGVDKKLATKLRSLENYNAVYCNWAIFGHENLQDHPADIRTAITHRQPNLWKEVKCIFKPRSIQTSQLWVHWLLDFNGNWILDHPKIRIANNLIKLNHYQLQSLEFFTKVKMTRGDVAGPNEDKLRYINYFNSYNAPATYEDNILKNLIENCPDNY